MQSKKVAILQSCYIPWKGYFDLINQVDEFILYDDVQFTRRDWRNRNLIKTSSGLSWLTIPVKVKGKYHQKIKEVIINDSKWSEKHWKTIVHNYSKALYFKEYKDTIEPLFIDCREKYLSKINFRFIRAICDLLGIKTKISWSMDYNLVSGKSERLVNVCLQSGASEYVSGPSAQSYLEPELFEAQGIRLVYTDYENYPIYRQLFPPFVHKVTILDLLFNEGPKATHFMKTFGNFSEN